MRVRVVRAHLAHSKQKVAAKSASPVLLANTELKPRAEQSVLAYHALLVVIHCLRRSYASAPKGIRSSKMNKTLNARHVVLASTSRPSLVTQTALTVPGGRTAREQLQTLR